MRDIESELAIFCNQARLSVEGLGPQSSHITFDVGKEGRLGGGNMRRGERGETVIGLGENN